MNTTDTSLPTHVDVLIAGGGAAGLAAAEALVRARRSVAVVDSGAPRNGVADGVHNFLTRDGTPPAELLRLGRAEVERYGVAIVDGEIVRAEGASGDFRVTLASGATIRSRRLLLATGGSDALPAVDGLDQRWGRDVLHCPYCHGWEVQDGRIGIIATGAFSVHQALLFRQWSDNITFFTAGDAGEAQGDPTAPTLTGEQRDLFAALGIVVEGAVASVTVTDDRLTGVVLRSGVEHPIDALVVMPRVTARVTAFAGLGIEATEHESGMGTVVRADAMGQTDVAGVWVAGNATDPSAQVIASAAAGLMVGARINADLITEEQAAALAAYRAG